MARRFLLAGQWTESPEVLNLRSPWPSVACTPVFQATAEHAGQAAQAARAAFAPLKALSRFQRSEALRFISVGIRERGEDIACAIRDEAGKPMALARSEVQRAVRTFLTAAEETLRPPGAAVFPDREAHGAGLVGRLEYVPCGPVLAITPFNFPLNLVAHKVAPALSAGCPVVLKPPPQAPGAALLLGEIALASGLPPAALQVLPGGLETGQALCARPEFAIVSFTGSAAAGWAIKKSALPRQKVLLELGGNAALIVDQSADIEAAVNAAAPAAYAYAGQICISTQRIFVHRAVSDRFERRLAETILGSVAASDNPADEQALVGPLIDERAAARVQTWIDAAVGAGAGVRVRGARKGPQFVTPWLLEAVPREQPLACEEVFGPVATLDAVADFDEALARANDSRFGLQTSVFTQSLKNAERAYAQLECGAVLVNVPTTFRLDSAVYGGVKDSGFGREGLAETLREFCEPKLFVARP
jgi:acyl-CoA reductase-like NAD-dependent aldehyde dehydrogenase